jgi:ribosome-interacting GTPase 1
MPTNLPPDYFEADKRFREAQTPAEKIACLEEMISIVPKHKGTDKLRADLRRQLSHLREEAQSRKKTGGHTSAYVVEREGAGQVVILGPTNVGKSSLVAALTNAQPEISAAPYTTWKPAPGMMPVENIQVQLVDTPPLDRDYVEGGLFELARRSDLIVLMVDLQADPLQQLEDALAILQEHRIAPPERRDVLGAQERMSFVPMMVVVNKCDDPQMDEDFTILCELFEEDCPLLPISVQSGRNLEAFRREVFSRLDIIRVYAKPPGKPPDLERPFVLKKGATVDDLALKIHRDFYNNLKSARVWGSSVFDGQLVQRDYQLQDGDIVELRA